MTPRSKCRSSRYAGLGSLNGFSLIELMMVVAIIGIMLTLAIPSYTAFSTRAKMTELISVMMKYKVEVAEYASVYNEFPETGAGTQFKNVNRPSKYIRQIRFRKAPRNDAFFIEARPSDKVHPDLRPKHSIVLRGRLGTPGSPITWECGTYSGRTSQIPQNILPANCRQPLKSSGK